MTSFTDIYKKNIWGSSGTGSTYNRDNQKLIRNLDALIKIHRIKTVCDFGCGDFQIMKHLDFEDITYTGVDLVDSVISNNLAIYSKDNINFTRISDKEQFAKGYDLVIIKDVLQHHTDKDVIKILSQLLQDNKYVFCINGFKFGRSDKEVPDPRSIDNRYRYCPLSSVKYPLKNFAEKEHTKYRHRCKEYILYLENIYLL